MNLTTQKRLAASILKVGVNRVWIDPDEIEEVSRAITRDGIKQLIDQGIIKAKPKTGISSYRSKKIKEQKKKGKPKRITCQLLSYRIITNLSINRLNKNRVTDATISWYRARNNQEISWDFV